MTDSPRSPQAALAVLIILHLFMLVTLLAILLSLVSFGPHKVVDPAFPLIWPAVVTAWGAVGCLVLTLFQTRRGREGS